MAAPPLEDSAVQYLSTLGRYRLLAQLGQGGMGAVYLAVMRGSGDFEKLVVLKELRPDLAENTNIVSMFLQEAKLAGRLNHSNIVQTLEAGKIDERYFLSMEYLDGQPFSNLLFQSEEGKSVPLSLRLQVVSEVLAGLHYAHELRDFDQTPLLIVHCDVSPSNVFVTYDGSIKVIDFGVAKAAGQVARSKGFQGKVRYASPEQLQGYPLDRRADVFSAGVLLWEAITLARYDNGAIDDDERAARRIRGEELGISHLHPNVDPALAEIVDRAMKNDANERFPTAEQFREALVDYMTLRDQRMDSSQIARILRSKFAATRTETHQLIQRQLKGSGEVIPTLFKKTPGHDDLTTVADLSTFVRATRKSHPPVSTPPVWTAVAQRKALSPVLLGAGALGLTVAIALLSSGGSEDSPLEQPPPPDKTVLDLEEPNEPATAAPQEKNEPEQPAKEASKNEIDADDSVKKKNATPARSTKTQRTWPRPQPTSDASPQRPAPAPTPTPAAPQAEPDAKAPAQKSVFDQDLGAPAQRQRRSIDDDNPFR